MTLESFFGLETEGAGSPESREQFQEQMREAARAIKNMSAHQAAQKKKEDKLAQLLIRLMRDTGKSDVVFLVVKLLEENVPGAFILAVLSIADPEMEKELIESFDGGNPEDSALRAVGEEFIPDEIKKELNAWGDAILSAGLLLPGKTLLTVLTPDQKLKSILLDLLQFSLEEYFYRRGLEFAEDKIRQVALLSIQTVLIRLRDRSREQTDIDIIEAPLPEER
ncbi:hypothetical protein A3J23_03320 [Candidatus Peregrinibacteria bacterium RIFCSPLOWO2_02_FULL_48_14]|nr:MAG: hypothetical protein A3J23_03320 [Candidatus Peregrinibacteria bacterium RIFCSPLOWO2_02_FULL_48_14]